VLKYCLLTLPILILTSVVCNAGEVLAETPLSWEVNLTWKDIPLEQIPCPTQKVEIKQGRADIYLTIWNTSEGTKYKGKGEIKKGEVFLQKLEEKVRNLNMNFIMEDKKLHISSLRGELGQVTFSGTGELTLDQPYPFELDIEAKEVQIKDLAPYVPQLKPYTEIKSKGDICTTVKGKIPLDSLEGEFSMDSASIYSVLMKNLNAQFAYHSEKFQIKNFSLEIGEGKIQGEGEFLFK